MPLYDSDSDSESDSNSYYDSNSESDNESDDEDYTYDLAKESVFYISVSDYKNLSPKDTKKFIENVKEWTYNNPVNKEHVQSIQKSLMKRPHLTGVFSIVKLDNGTYYFIDGHHRVKALKKIYKVKPKFKIDITVHCYYSDTLDSEKTIKLFNRLNNTKPFKPVTKHIDISIVIIKKLNEDFPNMFRDAKTKSLYPYVHKTTLNKHIQTKLKTIEGEISTSNIIAKFHKYNNRIKRNLNDYLRRHQNCKTNAKLYKKESRVKEIGCYLGVVKIEKLVSEIFD